MRYEDLPFSIGGTYFDDKTPNATDGVQFEGKEYDLDDLNWASGDIIKPILSGMTRRVRVVRNVTGSALLPKRIARMNVSGSAQEALTQINGYADTVGQHGFPIDEFLPAAGVANNDLCYVVVRGRAKVTTAAAGDTNIAQNAFVIPSTSGTVIDQDTSVAAGAATFAQVQGAIGRAVLAVNAISTDFSIIVTHR